MQNQKTLAVKYRPKIFEEVCGQKTVIHILKNQITNSTYKQAYLFSGKSGSGKTTTARIFAREINKSNNDIIEIDAASHNSVDNVRQILDNAKTLPLFDKHKIYIIDEAHMISQAGWAAFLKGIEEPPAFVIYIFCTTDPQKLPTTILNRLQRFDFTAISINIIADRLEQILKAENINTYERQALEHIAMISGGGMRESISNMEKCLYFNSTLNIDNVSEALGIISNKVMFNLLSHIENKNVIEVDIIIQDIYKNGIDLKLFLNSFLHFIINIIKYKITLDNSLCGFSVGYEKELSELKNNKEFYVDIMNGLIKLIPVIKYENSPLSFIEAFFMRLCF